MENDELWMETERNAALTRDAPSIQSTACSEMHVKYCIVFWAVLFQEAGHNLLKVEILFQPSSHLSAFKV